MDSDKRSMVEVILWQEYEQEIYDDKMKLVVS